MEQNQKVEQAEDLMKKDQKGMYFLFCLSTMTSVVSDHTNN